MCTSTFAKNYLPLETSSAPDIPQKISLHNQELTLFYKNHIDKVSMVKKKDSFLGTTAKGEYVGVSDKGTALIVTFIDKDKTSYKTHIFREEGLKLPQKDTHFATAPTKDNYFVSSPSFIASYPVWSADDTAYAYDLLSHRERGVIKMFPYVATELAEKLCASPEKTSGIFQLTNGQDVSCVNINNTFTVMSRSGRIKDFKIRADAERKTLRSVFECGQGLRSPKQCQNISGLMAKRALQVKSIKSVLQEFK